MATQNLGRQGKIIRMKHLVITLLLLPGICFGNRAITDPDTLPNKDFVEDTAPWEERAASLPAYPRDESLVPINVSSAASNKHMIDTASLSVGNDKVIRYTIVIDSPRGARTVNYEGLRCDTAERKIYAFGQSDGKWTENKRATWEGIKVRSLLSYHKILFEDIFCELGIPIGSIEEGVQKLKQQARGF